MKKSKSYTTVLLLAVFACGSDGIGPSNINVNSAPDLFRLQMLSLENNSEVLSYNWVITGTQATLSSTNGISAGSVAVTIRDSGGSVVFQGDLAGANGVDTSVGVSGTWVIEVDLATATGGFTLGARLA